MSFKPLIEWLAGALIISIHKNDEEHVRLHSVRLAGSPQPGRSNSADSDLPLANIRLSGEGREADTSKRQINGYLSRRLRYVRHEERECNEGVKYLDVVSQDAKTGLTVTNHFTVYPKLPVLRSSVTVENCGKSKVTLQTVSSLIIQNLTSGSIRYWEDYRVSFARSDWFREAQWQDVSLPSVGIDDYEVSSTRACFSISNLGSFSTGGHLPMGALTRADGCKSWLWQIEHNGSWRWEIADYHGGLYLNAAGPSDEQNWSKPLPPGGCFTSVPVGLVIVDGTLEKAFGALTKYRRRIRRKHVDNEELPVIFNDYMNCLMGNPTMEKVDALIEPAVKMGAEYFCIDCGWYADVEEDWWPSVGAWEPSQNRFPGVGLKGLLQKIKEAGLIPGLWIEPEVVGINSPVAAQLPKEAFFQRDGERVIEVDRYQLDYRHPAVIERMNSVIQRLVDIGAGYFKFDYNLDITQGTDVNAHSPGDGQMEHNRAYIKWVSQLFDRFPDLVIESCSSGGQRMDYALLAVHPLQSTSDQEDPVKYAAVAASAPTAVTPEQSASWAYPQPEWSEELNALTVINSLLGRVHLSGRVDKLSAEQQKLVADGITVYKSIRAELRHAIPIWPLGLPGWSDNWVALGMDCGTTIYISVWRRSGANEFTTLRLTDLTNQECDVKCLYPLEMPGDVSWNLSDGALEITIPNVPAARLFKFWRR